MSVRKLRFFTMLVMVVAFVPVGRLSVQGKEFDVPTAESEISPSVLLPVQSKNVKDLGAGKLLVASRNLADPNFAQTVVLLVHYDAEGVVGLILNRRTHVPLSRVLEGLKAAKDRSDPVYLGGPVETPAVFALLRSPAKLEGAEHVFGGVYLISTQTLFEQTFSSRPDPGVFHVYLGYAGWTKDQLRKEVELGAWFIFPADASTVFNSDPDSLWPQMIRKTELKLAGSEPADADQGRSYTDEHAISASLGARRSGGCACCKNLFREPVWIRFSKKLGNSAG
jgi:putative transcriptional regulator